MGPGRNEWKKIEPKAKTKNGHITTTNITLILYLQFTSKTVKARYTLCPDNFRMYVACAEKRFLADMMEHISPCGEPNRSIRAQMV